MAAFHIFRPSDPLSTGEKEQVVAAIREAEKRTSGEIRVFIERKCRFVDPLDRAAELFWRLQMENTVRKNAVLIYVAVRDHQYAIYADEGIHQALGPEFWNGNVKRMQNHFRSLPLAEAISRVIEDTGTALEHHFPGLNQHDRNELSDEIIFGS